MGAILDALKDDVITGADIDMPATPLKIWQALNAM